MRIVIFMLLAILLTQQAITQDEKPSAQKKMQAQMLEAINQLNNQIAELEKQLAEAIKNKEDEETIKGLKEQIAMLKKQVAMMGGVSKKVSGISEKTFQETINQDSNKEDVPKKDINRIKTLPDKVLTDAELMIFVKNITAEVEKKISPEQLKQAKIIYNTAKEKKLDAGMNNLASLCWMNNYTELALYFAGKACIDDPKNPDNLNNYSAFLTMTGGEHLALPILQNLNRRFPGNSTILNNIGQSWYGLGDMNNANRYLDSTVRIYRHHSEANRTKCEIQKSEGQTNESIESLKRSIQEDYTPEKEARLKKLGGSLKYDDIPFRYPAKAEPLGIEQFMFSIPAYPFEGGASAQISSMEWDDFRKKIGAAQEAIQIKSQHLQGEVELYKQRVLANPLLLKPYNNIVYITANRKLTLLVQWGIDRLLAFNERHRESANLVQKWRNEYSEALNDAMECGTRKGLASSFLMKANLVWQQFNADWMTLQKQILNAQTRLSLYAYSDRSAYLLAIESIKHGFLTTLRGLACEFEVGCLQTDPASPQGRVLPDFDEINCQYKTDLSIPYMEKTFSIKVECNKMTTKFDLPFIKAEIQENLNTNKLIDVVKGKVEFSQGFSKDIPLSGPLSAEMELNISAFVEFDNSGITDVGIEGQLSATAETTNLDKSIVMEDGTKVSVPGVSEQKLELGVNVRSSWNAGTTVSGTGLFGGSRVSFK